MKIRPLLLLAALASPVGAQILLNPPKDASVIHVDVDLVNVLCTVRDKRGAFAKDLTKDDFEVREDGRRQEITHFARDVDTPLSVALLLDVSGSVSSILDIEKAAAKRFFSEVLRPSDQALLVGFAQLVTVWQELTPSIPTLEMALDDASPSTLDPGGGMERRPRGGTLLYDAVNLVASQKMQRLPGRKVILLITDGEDNGSIVHADKAAKAAQEADAVIYGIHYEDSLGHARGDGMSALAKLSEPTGGRTFHVSKSMTLDAIFDAITEEMRNQYAIGYPPPNAAKDGTYHKLEVKMVKPGLKVAARNGYYAVAK